MALTSRAAEPDGWSATTVALPDGPAADPLAWLAAAPSDGERWFWEAPEQGVSWVGLGVADSIDVDGGDRFAEASRSADDLFDTLKVDGPAGAPLPRLAAGFGFDDHPGRGRWGPLGAGRLVLPAVQVLRRDDGAWLTSVGGPAGPLPTRRAPDPIPLPDTDPADWASPAARHHYRNLVQTALAAIAAGELVKAVPCRSLTVPGRPGVAGLLATLRDTYPACTTFCVGRHPVTFVGSTPERLAAVDGRRLNTAALAGSAPRSPLPGVDDAIGQGLLTSPKERSEHAVVVEAIDEALSGLGVVPEHPPEPTLLRLHGIQHLHTPIRAEIRPSLSLLEVVGALHPTPAVAGHPRARANQLRSEHEGFDRGWFAGPVGWIDAAGHGEFRVALRSALIDENDTTLYAGAGVVPGSDPDRELLETDMKLQAMLGPVLASTAGR